MKVLLLGGTGVMGVPLTNELVHRGHEVFVTSRKVHNSLSPHVKYHLGNAFDLQFLEKTLENHYDVIVDFLNYKTIDFSNRVNLLLSSTGHYYFLSSCRVFTPQSSPLKEDSARLLDSIDDKKYLDTDEYALAKARCENILFENANKNWTILRPYITYGPQRIQLSMYEKEGWIYRATHNRSVLFFNDLSQRQTCLTFGDDVSKAIAVLVHNGGCYQESFNIVGDDSMKWEDVLNYYNDVFEIITGKKFNVVWKECALELSRVLGNTYKYKYDRLSDRVFDNSKIKCVIKDEFEFTSMRDGLRESLTSFLNSTQKYSYYNVFLEAWVDKQVGERSMINSIPGFRNKIKYFLLRETPYLDRQIPKGDVCW